LQIEGGRIESSCQALSVKKIIEFAKDFSDIQRGEKIANHLWQENIMIELTENSVYKLIKKLRDNGVVLDYVILQNEADNHSINTHKLAAVESMSIIAKRCDDYALHAIAVNPLCKKMKRKDFPVICWNDKKLTPTHYSVEQFFARPADSYYLSKPIVKSRAWELKQYAEYALAFLEPPYGNKYVVSDWEMLNRVLFSSPSNLDIYKWSSDWSNYFDDGLEWWGAFYWTVYDLLTDCFVVIGGSATD
jgi:hypothetical protein